MYVTASLAFNEGDYKLYGSKRMHVRPIKDLVDSLNSIGSKIQYLEMSSQERKIIKESLRRFLPNHALLEGRVSLDFFVWC